MTHDPPLSLQKERRIVHLTTVHRLRDPRIFHKQVGSLRAAGYDVHLVAQHPRTEVVEGVPVVGLRPTAGRYRRLGLLREAYQKARALDAALYHFHDPELIPVAYALRRATGAKIIYDVHEDYPTRGGLEGRLLDALERWCFGWVDQAVVVHSGLRARAEAHGARTTVIANYFKPRGDGPPTPKTWTPDTPFKLLYAGVIARIRGLDTLLDLAEHIGREGLHWRMYIVGVCYYEPDRRAAAPRLDEDDVQDGLWLVGWDAFVPPDEMTPFFAEAHVGLVPWLPHANHVAVPTKMYEYLYHGLPILCADFPRWRAFVTHHGCGAVFDPHDSDAALAILRQWADDPATYARLSAAAAEAARGYTWSVMEARLLALYDGLLSE